MENIIYSEQNQWLRRVRALQLRKYRQQYGQFVAEGSRFVQEALLKGAAVEAVLVAQSSQEAFAAIRPADWQGEVHLVADGLLEKALNTANPQGIAAIVQKPSWAGQTLAEMRNILILDGIQDPGNLGTLIRTALASGVQGVFCLKGTVDLYNDKTLRATMGAVFALPVFTVEDHQTFFAQLKVLGFMTVLADIRGAQWYDQVVYPARTALVMGNEANGLQQIKSGDVYVKIPLHGGAESLNVAVAAGVILYEIERQRRV